MRADGPSGWRDRRVRDRRRLAAALTSPGRTAAGRLARMATGVAMLAGVACGSNTMTSVEPSPVRCDVSLAAPSDALPSSGGSAIVTVATEAECEWSASADESWITGLTPASGRGSGEVRVDAAPNPGPPRSGALVVEGARVTLQQESGCTYAIEPDSRSVDAGGGSGTVSIVAHDGCAWTATSQAAWIEITSGSSGDGAGVVAFTAAPNTTPARTGTVTVAGRTLIVTQASGCTYTVQPQALSVEAGGESSSVMVSAGAGCTWDAESHVAWIAVAPGAGAGSGDASFVVAGNAGPERTGSFTVAGQSVTVTQASGCTFALSPDPLDFGVIGRQFVTVATEPGCAWTAVPSDTWIVILSGGTGVGPGRIDVAVAPFFGSRTGTLTVGRQSVVVRQNVE